MFKRKCFYFTELRENAEVVRELSLLRLCNYCALFRSRFFFFFCEHTIPDSLFSASVWNFEDLQYFDWYSWKFETEYGLKTWNINDSFLNLTRLMLTAVLPRAFCFRTRFHPICFQNSSKRGQWFTAYYQKVWLPRGCKQDLYPLGKRHS